MNWLSQTEGIINHYKEKYHFGNQPIRVLHYMNVYMFHMVHPTFVIELKKAIDIHGLSDKLDIIYGDEHIKFTPKIRNHDKKILLHETFLSYLWCISNSIYTLYLEEVDFPKCNALAGFEKYKVEQEKIDKAIDLFAYAKSLIVDYVPWDKENLPNPEIYKAEERDFIEQPNIFYTHAIMFILCHEYIHAIKHIDIINSQKLEDSHFIEFEKEADFEAIELLKKGIMPTKINELGITVGVTIGILSMFFFRSSTSSIKHPNTEDRLTSALEQMNLSDDTPCWGIALVGIKLWAEQFNLEINISQDLTEKESYYDVIKQIKRQNTNA
ncbi:MULTISPECIES: phage exclusion protein Lit family protein [unclassified Empedobacter]|uniref:phage exclusion protein Lit family protein n=1 Tax=unclassified Empedobacter TaxID=2643773 RepID=UPI0025C137CE|nr:MULTISPECIES: phage exclusion protein Lit family protein [unclassified Empedobacter]